MKRKLQVFVSSTYTDLRDERQAAVETILRTGHIPAGMELFAAGDLRQWDVIRRWIEDSDVYMLVLGARYGSLHPDGQRSYVQAEYEYALELKKPLFAVVMSEQLFEVRRISNDGRFETTHLALYIPFRRAVLARMSRFFDDPKDIRLAVHESLSDISENKGFAGGWLPAREIPDTNTLLDEIARLRAENKALREEYSLGGFAVTKQDALAEFARIRATLDETPIDAPSNVSTQGPFATLASVLLEMSARLVAGVEHGVSATDTYVYRDVAPNLAVFGLTERRHFDEAWVWATTDKGNQFLAYLLETLADERRQSR